MFTNFEIMTSKSKVYFFFDNVNPPLRNRAKLKEVVESIFEREKQKLDRLNYIFCTDKKLLKINRQYLKHDYYTDIITFDLSEVKGITTGEIYISVDRVKDNAEKLGESFGSEIRRVIFHGALHLCGYNDKNKAEKGKMREKEKYYLEISKS